MSKEPATYTPSTEPRQPTGETLKLLADLDQAIPDLAGLVRPRLCEADHLDILAALHCWINHTPHTNHVLSPASIRVAQALAAHYNPPLLGQLDDEPMRAAVFAAIYMLGVNGADTLDEGNSMAWRPLDP